MYPIPQLLRLLLRSSGILRGRDSSTSVPYDSCSDSYYGPQAFSEVGIVLQVYLIPQLLRFLVWTSDILRGKDSSTLLSYTTTVQILSMDLRHSQR